MNCSKFISKLSEMVIPALVGAMLLVGPGQTLAQGTEVIIEQIQPGQMNARTSSSQIFAEDEDVESNGVVPIELNTSSSRSFAGRGNLSMINQSGNGNYANIDVTGSQNLTLLQQRGAFNQSEMDILGSRNLVMVDQNGIGLNSDINVDGAQGKTVVHLQRGRASSRSMDPINVTNQDSSVILVVDTPRGRRIVTK